MKLIDTHCHLCHGRLRPQVDDVLNRARAAGVVAMICAAGDLPESAAALGLGRREPDVYSIAGVHPHDAREAPPDYLDRVEQLAADPKNVAIGEIGLDYHHDYSPRDDQRRVFAEQLELGRRIAKTIVVHTRDAFDDTLRILAESGVAGEKVVFHSWTGEEADLRRALDIGATISFSGIVTFKKTAALRESARLVPPDRLLIETDAPFLSPVPVRKMRTNEPANVAHVAACLGELLACGTEQLAERTTANAVRFFGLDIAGAD